MALFRASASGRSAGTTRGALRLAQALWGCVGPTPRSAASAAAAADAADAVGNGQ